MSPDVAVALVTGGACIGTAAIILLPPVWAKDRADNRARHNAERDAQRKHEQATAVDMALIAARGGGAE